MSQTETFDILIEKAREARDLCARECADAQVWRNDSASKLELLSQYRLDYFSRLQSGLSHVDAAPALARFGAFIIKLEEAIAQQGADLKLRDQSVAAARARLAQCERKLRSLEVYIDRKNVAAELVEHKRDQKTMDEYAARAARLAPAGMMGSGT
jgi:flagellar FliJ protein